MQVLEGLEKLKENGTSWSTSVAIALLSCFLSLQVGVMEVQAYPELVGANPNSTVSVELQKRDADTKFGDEVFELGQSSGAICLETYGFLPCSTSVGGNLFLMLGYGYLLFTAAKFISEGSELLLEVRIPSDHNFIHYEFKN